MSLKLGVMGISGCGKTTVAKAIARALDCEVVEGDDYHLPSSQEKMARGIPLSDADRLPWLDALGVVLQKADGSLVMSCSALKRAYRERLRAAEPALLFVYVHNGVEDARRRVALRSSHFFPPTLVDSQFKTLESPEGEPGVLRVEASEPVAAQCEAILRWLCAAAPVVPSVPKTQR
jgi:gluconokinase